MTQMIASETTPLRMLDLLNPMQAGGLASLFKVLANDTRLRLLHSLIRTEEMCVTELAKSLGMSNQAVSNQLHRLSDVGILASRREGNNIHYRLVDCCVRGLLEEAWCLIDSSKQTINCHAE